MRLTKVEKLRQINVEKYPHLLRRFEVENWSNKDVTTLTHAVTI